jgi:hypothetical protein
MGKHCGETSSRVIPLLKRFSGDPGHRNRFVAKDGVFSGEKILPRKK